MRTHPQSLEYLQTYQRATIVLGADEDPRGAFHSVRQFDRRAGLLEAVKYLREFGHRHGAFPTAFIGLNNLVTKGALRALLELGYAVPADLSLVGYDNLPEMQFAAVPVTTVGLL